MKLLKASRNRIFIFLLLINASFVFSQSQWLNFTCDDLFHQVVIGGESIWVGYRGGLTSIDRNTEEECIYNAANSELPANFIQKILLIEEDRLWVTSGYSNVGVFNKGIYKAADIKIGNSELEFYNNDYRQVVDSNGDLICSGYYRNENSYETRDVIVKIQEDGPLEILERPQFGCYDLCKDVNGNIWYTGDYGQVRILREGDDKVFHSSNSPLPYGISFIGIHAWENGVAVLQMDRNYSEDSLKTFINRHDGTDWLPTVIKITPKFNNRGVQTLVDPLGGLWFSFQDGFYLFKDEYWERYDFPFPSSDYRSDVLLNVEDNGRWWFHHPQNFKNEIYSLDDRGVKNYNISNSDIGGNLINDLFIDSKNRTWIATHKSVAKLESSEWTNYFFEINELNHKRQFTYSIGEDLNRDIWIGLHHDVDPYNTFLRYDGEEWETIRNGAGGINTDIEAFFFDKNNVLWAATSYGLLEDDGVFTKYHNTYNSALTKNFLYNLEPTSDSTFCVIAASRSFDCYDGSDIISMTPLLQNEEYIYEFHMDENGVLWVYSHFGLGTFENEEINYIDSFPEVSIFDITQDSRGTFWFATSEGLMRYDREKFEFVNEGSPGGWLLNVEVDSFDNVWMSSPVGLAVYNSSGIEGIIDGKNEIVEDSVRVNPNITKQCGNLFSPNPTKQISRLDNINDYSGGILKVYNTRNTLISEIQDVQSGMDVYFDNYPTGMYFYQLEKGEQHCIGKLKIE